ncbi:hypothetical protein J6590_103935, partial [Homalodisca vitripennis]
SRYLVRAPLARGLAEMKLSPPLLCTTAQWYRHFISASDYGENGCTVPTRVRSSLGGHSGCWTVMEGETTQAEEMPHASPEDSGGFLGEVAGRH